MTTTSDTGDRTYEFDASTAVVPDGENRYRAEVGDGWGALGGMPNGGYVLGICIRALGLDLPQPDPLVVAAFFMRRARPGPATVLTERVHGGRRHATGAVRLLQEEREVVRAVATFTDLDRAAGRTLVLNEPPDLPRPEDCIDPLGISGFPRVTITERVEYRAPGTPGWLRGEPTGRPEAEFWMRFKDDRPIDTLALVSLVDAAAPAVVELGEGSSTIELTVHIRAKPDPSPWVACRVGTRHVIDGYHEEDFEIWDASGVLVAQARQLALLPTG